MSAASTDCAADPDQSGASSPASEQAPSASKPERRRGVATKDESGKWQATGDYDVGFGRPPARNRFRKGNPGGPGRPTGSRSQDSIKREKLNRKETVTVDGRTQKVSRRELAEELLHKKALEKGGDPKLLVQMSADAQRLFPETANDNGKASVFGDASMDGQILKAFLASLSIGEPAPGAPDPDLLTGTPIADFTGADSEEGWNEGDWEEAGGQEPGDGDPDGTPGDGSDEHD